MALSDASWSWSTPFSNKRAIVALNRSPVDFTIPLISLCKTIDPRIRAIFGHRAIIWTNMIEVLKVMLHTKYHSSRPSGFRQEDFFKFSIYKPMYNICPHGGAISGPRGTIWTNLLEFHKVMLNNKYQGFRPCGFRQEDFFTFPYISLCKTRDPLGEAIFGPRAIIWTNLVKVH